MNFLEKTNNIKKYNCSILVSEEKNGHLNICKVDCVSNKRKNKWTHLFPSVYSDCALLRDKYLLDLPGKFFIVYQINEHSRGGHSEYEMQLMDIRGQVFHQFSSRDRIVFMLDKTTLWVLKSGKKPIDYSRDIDVELLTINTKTGGINQHMELNFQRLLNLPNSRVFFVKFSEKRGKNLLKIVYTDELNNKHSKHIQLSSGIFTDFLD